MNLARSLRAIRSADGDRLVDWTAAATAASASTPRGDLDLAREERERYATAVDTAHAAVERTLAREVVLPPTVEVLDRHHWIDRTATSFGRIVDPALSGVSHHPVARTVNTATASVTLGLLARRVVGQYDPALVGDPGDRALYLVHPNLASVAGKLEVDPDRFRRWVVHHELAHAAEFSVAPWLVGHLEAQIERALDSLSTGRLDRDAVAELDRTMTAVEGFAELVMDEAMAEDVGDLRERLEARRAGVNPLVQLLDWALGLATKRRQYERGRTFFRAVHDARGIDGAMAVWSAPEALPTTDELERPQAWLRRMDA
ncbi:MAG: zinc-dependent metalloprotease [Halobacteriales archaeon]